MLGLEEYEGAPVNDIRSATRRAVENLVQLANDKQVDFVILAGDIYDGDWDDYNTGLFFLRQMHALNCEVVLISGNHDAQSKMTKTLTLPNKVHWLSANKPNTHTNDELRVAIHGQSYKTRAVTDDLSQSYPAPVTGYFNIGVLHTSADGREGHANYAPCSVENLRAFGYEYWALGHVHTRECLSEDPPIHFPGNTQGRHIRETGAKGCLVVTVDGAEITTDFEPLDVARWEVCSVQADTDDTFEDVLAKVEEALADASDCAEGRTLAVRVEITGRSAAYESIKGAPEHFLNEVRARSLSTNAPIWIETAKLLLEPAESRSPSDDDGPWEELDAAVEELASTDDEELLARTNNLDALKKKLGAALGSRDDIAAVREPDALREWMRGARPLIQQIGEARE